MPLTITINEAAPGTLTIGVGTPGVGVPTGGTAGQVLTKVDSTDYNTVFATPSADYITAVTAPLAVASGNLSVNLSAYLTSATAASTYQTLAGMSSYLTTATAASTYYLQTNPSGFQTAANVTTALSPYLLSATAASTYQTLAGMSSYLTTSAAASTYAVIAAGLPTGGTVGQVLTKNSGTNFDASFATLIPGDRYLTTSTTSNTIGNGAKTFTVGTGLSYTPTQDVTISYDASNHMHAEVTTYNSGTGVLVVDVKNHTGSGTFAAWTVNVGGVTPLASVAWGAITGTLGNQTDLANALNTYLPLAGGAMTGAITSAFNGMESEVSEQKFKVKLTSTPSMYGELNYQALTISGVGTQMIVTPTGLTFPDASTQTTAATNFNPAGYATESWVYAGFYPLSGNPSAFLTDAPSDGTTYGRNNAAWVATIGNPPYSNSVWTSGGYASASVTNIYDTGTSMYYNVLTF